LCITAKSAAIEERDVKGLHFDYPREAFEHVRRVSEINDRLYQTYVSPWVRAAVNPLISQISRKANSLFGSFVPRYGQCAMHRPLLSTVILVVLGTSEYGASRANAQPFGGWGMMGYGPGGNGEWGPIGMIIWILFLVLIIAAVVWFVRAMTQSGQQPSMLGRRSSGLDVLEERYARGEINRDEYLEKKHDIGG
jgi:putative membrane protein